MVSSTCHTFHRRTRLAESGQLHAACRMRDRPVADWTLSES